ncbi:MAG: 1-acyl-sn-glycerol-3-phosphate acyltransferase [Nannocystis sp.]|nr:1-acyl-sn-glycerol-3-phosphate acyltransferase [Nannocystis sp.]
MLLSRLRTATRAGEALAWTALELARVEARMALAPEGAREALFEREMKRWSRGLLWIGGVRLHLSEGPPPPPHGARLVVANHRAALDIPILLSLFGGSVLSRADLAEWPVLGYAARRAQTIFVDRDSRQSGVKAIRAIREQLQRGRTVSIFPEGTTTAGDQLLPFNSGSFAAARGLPVEIVPVGLAYPSGLEYTEDTFLAHLGNVGARPRISIGVAIGPPIAVEARSDRLAQRLQGEIQALVYRARAAAG